jgi:NADP-reducing hydrogenase subunit HndB
LKSIEDLQRIKEETLTEIQLRDSAGKPKVTIGMGTCGIAAGARETMLSIIDELKRRQKFDVTVSETGCVGLCVKEPIVEIEVPGMPKVVYGNVDKNKARLLVASHIVNHEPVEDLVINAEDKEKEQ